MINIVLFGPPGAGKGTQSEKLVKEFGLAHLSTGDVFRYHIKNQTELGELAKSYIDKGELVPDEVTINLLKAEIEKSPAAKGYIFDGFPRTVPQAIALDNMLAEKNDTVTMMISLIVEEEELVKRLLARGQDSGRTDDTDESIIRNRIRVYNEQTAIAADFYKKQNKYFEIKGKGVIDEIYSKISQLIKFHNQTS